MNNTFQKKLYLCSASFVSFFGFQGAVARNPKVELYSQADALNIEWDSAYSDTVTQVERASKPLRMEDLTYVKEIGFSMNKPSIYQDELGQSWFIKKGDFNAILSSHLSSKFLCFLYPGRFAESRLIEGNPSQIASKMIPDLLSLPTIFEAGCEIEFSQNKICDRPLVGLEQVMALRDFLGFSDVHASNFGVVKQGEDYLATMVDYDMSAVWSGISFFSLCGVNKLPINSRLDQKFAVDESRLTVAYQPIIDLTDEQIELIVGETIDDLNDNQIPVSEEIQGMLCANLIRSRNYIKDLVESQIIIEAVLQDDVEAVQALLQKRSILTIHTYDGTSLLEIVKKQGSQGMQELLNEMLYKHGIEYPNAEDCDKESYLVKAVKESNVSLVRFLLQAKVDINADPSLLVSAVEAGDISVMRLLLEEPSLDISRQTRCGAFDISFFGTAVNLNNIEMVQLLLSDSRISPNIGDKYERWTGLEIAINNNNLRMLQLLLAHPDIDINRLNVGLGGFTKNTPLLTTIQAKNMEAMKLLLSRAEINVNWGGLNKDMPLLMAIAIGNMEAMKLLLEHPDIDVNLSGYAFDDNTRETCKGTPLFMAIQTNNIEAMKLLLNHPDIDVNLGDTDYRGDTYSAPWLMAMEKRNLEAVQLLFKHPHVYVDRAAVEAFCADQWNAYRYPDLAEFLGAYLKESQPSFWERMVNYFTGV